MSDSSAETYVFYRYHPSLAAAVVFIGLFGVTTLIHVVQLVRFRAMYFIPFLIGGAFEVIGYVGRMLSSNDPTVEGPYIMQTMMLLLGPNFFAATIYMILGRLVLTTDGERYSVIKKRWLTKIFVCGDVLSFFAQAAGGGLMASGSASSADLGQKVVVGGLVFQILFFGFFMCIATVFHYRIFQSPTPISMRLAWQKYMYALYMCSFFILIRSGFRVVEFLQGNDGALVQKELWVYAFDGLLMWEVMGIFAWFHPGQIVGKEESGLQRVVSSEEGLNVFNMHGVGLGDGDASSGSWRSRQK